MAIPARTYRVKAPNGAIHSVSWANARDLVHNGGFSFTKDEAVVVKEAQDEAEKAAFIKGNDPSALDVDELQKQYDTAAAAKSFDEMTRDELITFADDNGIEIDKRWGADKLLAAVKAGAITESTEEAA